MSPNGEPTETYEQPPLPLPEWDEDGHDLDQAEEPAEGE